MGMGPKRKSPLLRDLAHKWPRERGGAFSAYIGGFMLELHLWEELLVSIAVVDEYALNGRDEHVCK